MALLTVQSVAAPSLTPTFVAVASTDTVPADTGVLWLVVRNTGGGADTVTITDPGKTAGGSSAANPTVSVPATTGERWIPLFPAYVNTSTSVITVAHSATTGVTSMVVRAA